MGIEEAVSVPGENVGCIGGLSETQHCVSGVVVVNDEEVFVIVEFGNCSGSAGNRDGPVDGFVKGVCGGEVVVDFGIGGVVEVVTDEGFVSGDEKLEKEKFGLGMDDAV